MGKPNENKHATQSPDSTQGPMVILQIPVPADLAANLQLAAGEEESVGSYMVRLCKHFQDFPIDDMRPMFIGDGVRQRLEMALGKSVQDEIELASLMASRSTITVAGVKIQLDADQLEALHARNATGMDLKGFVTMILDRGVRAFLDGTLML